jgi:hypothetical protein
LEDRTLLSFAAPAAFDLGGAPNAVAVGRFEGASAPLDVATANANGTVSVFLGKGDGTLQNPIDVFVGGTPVALAVGDFLNNGLQDIVVATSQGSLFVLISNGNQTFQAPTRLSVGTSPAAVAVGKFNGSGNFGIVTANSNGSVSVFAGNGNGTFQSPHTTQVGGSFLSEAVGDLNGDGRQDLVVGTTTGIDILLGNGAGSFTLNQTVSFARIMDGIDFDGSARSVAMSDLRNDDKQDVIAEDSQAAGVVVLLGNGNGTVQPPAAQPSVGLGTVSFAVGDFNGDGREDIATSNSASQFGGTPSIGVLVGNGDGTFHTGPSLSLGVTATALAAGDFRGDSKLDLAMANNAPSNTLTLLQGNGNATFVAAPTLAVSFPATAIAAADFTGDGKPDLAVTGIGGSVSIFLNNGSGTFRPGTTLNAQSGGKIVTGDFTGNGKQDIAVSVGTSTIDIFLGNGDGTFQAPNVINLGNETIVTMVAGKFHNGRAPDLAVLLATQNSTEPTVVTLLNNAGKGNFVKGQTIGVGTEGEGLAAADFNGDGNLDLVTTSLLSSGTRDLKVLPGHGNGTFGSAISTPTPFSAFFVSAGAFTTDGKQDIVLVDYFNVDNSVLYMRGNGNGTFQPPVAYKLDAPLGFTAPAVGDFFGDGKLGFAVPLAGGLVGVFRGNGDGTFQAALESVTDFNGSQPNALAAADFNGDGKLDVAVTQYFGDDVSVLLNTTPPPSTAAPVATSTTLSSSANPAVFGQPIPLTATVTATTGKPVGSVTFFDGNTLLGVAAVDPNGHATLLVELSVGPHSLRAVFGSIKPFTTSSSAIVTETVNKDATTSTLAADPGLIADGLAFLTATIGPVAPGGGLPTGTVTFFDGNTIVGTGIVSNGQASLFLEGLSAGTHRLTASYSGDGDFLASLSAPLIITIA